ncbi:MAG: DNA gyrase subunit A [Candidatus Phytoplasma stylosanthis]|uniref:DNA gyrase subunit A n=1 Tax=Candidatus Phytoplasma stylosanthis TaxID=2798314 RepID=UPI00293A904E|nr:DNA gyrase subunit A [Candidatus Phytoplasma stylosanthis]MDV3167770.1 DNA gyrase subunit A [Candidatus Phytoplasma stylosanthis]MDV3170953.1 DNA gyrase subunit A [Candidatus Phytoplasma stylosanthis]MDV3173534.1 DNA gyrase subunit A [Candidatus Phytoplasma stylosanthis]MDV3174125.1 DNA gyrase subunit A [Candidatus Phytoplasma stylosanthis]MDV3202355.1 DNA gyrase subunit A [Candidatus Phytoplasma stylosanthis]
MSNKKKNDSIINELDLVNVEQNIGNVQKVNINEEMEKSFLDYAMSVIISRALPEIQDGLKPVQRRILYSMKELGISHQSSYKKAARVVGDVIGKYHPHGDISIYEAMVRMAQDFNYRYPLVDGHGNFGSIDGDAAAAMRYTEVRMSKLATELMREIDQNTIEFVNNYDNSEKEPNILPTSFPNLLVNGSTGIAVGMATNIPSHNFGEVIDALVSYIDDKSISVSGLLKHIKGPDFPTGGEILDIDNLQEIYETGRGRVILRAKINVVTSEKNKSSIIITEIPYQIKKSNLIENIFYLHKNKILDGITDLRDESSSRQGIKIVIELRKDVNPKVFLNNLYKHSRAQISFNFNMIVLIDKKPKLVNLKQILEAFFSFRIDIINRQKKFELKNALDKKHLIQAAVIVLNDIDEAIELIKNSINVKEAREKLILKYNFDETQSRYILEMSLQKITNLEIEKIKKEEKSLILQIKECEDIINSQTKKEQILKKDLIKLKNIFQDERKTIIRKDIDLNISNENLINKERILITVTNKGYIKRLNLETYKKQKKGGKGVIGIVMNENDFVEHLVITSTHDYQLFFTNKGKVYRMKGYDIPDYSRQSKGLPLINLIDLDKNEFLTSITSIISEYNEQDYNYLIFITKKGLIKRNSIKDYDKIQNNGKIAFNLKPDDEVLVVLKTLGNQDIIIASSSGKAIRFNEKSIKKTGRTGSGIIGMRLGADENIVGAAVVYSDTQDILVVTEFGYGKKNKSSEYRIQKRAGKGIKTLKITDKNGKLIALKTVSFNDELILISDRGKVIRLVNDDKIPTRKSKLTQGIKLFDLNKSDKLVNVVVIKKEKDII